MCLKATIFLYLNIIKICIINCHKALIQESILLLFYFFYFLFETLGLLIVNQCKAVSPAFLTSDIMRLTHGKAEMCRGKYARLIQIARSSPHEICACDDLRYFAVASSAELASIILLSRNWFVLKLVECCRLSQNIVSY